MTRRERDDPVNLATARKRRGSRRRAAETGAERRLRALRQKFGNSLPRVKSGRRRMPCALLFVGGCLAAAFGFGFIDDTGERSGEILRSQADNARVIDGDTVEVLGTRVRIANLDCAELPSAAGERAKLAAGVFLRSGAEISCTLSGRRSYDRELGLCAVDGRDLGEYLIANGACDRWW